MTAILASLFLSLPITSEAAGQWHRHYQNESDGEKQEHGHGLVFWATQQQEAKTIAFQGKLGSFSSGPALVPATGESTHFQGARGIGSVSIVSFRGERVMFLTRYGSMPETFRYAGEITVLEGDTLWNLSKLLGKPARRWKELLAENPGLKPKRIKPGRKLDLPEEWARDLFWKNWSGKLDK
jgi:hypothetical protein